MKHRFLKLTVLLITTTALLPRCATIVSKSNYPVHIRTNPAGANVTITDKKGSEVFKGTSPATVTLKSGAGFFSKAEYQVRLQTPSHQDKVIPINFKINGWYFGNILFGGIIGMLIVDPATGAMWKIVDPLIDVSFYSSTSSISEPTLNIIDLKDVSPAIKSKMVEIK